MCNKRNSTKVEIVENREEHPRFCGKYIFKADGCMANLIKLLNSKDLRTLGCCCGHGKYPMTIIAEDENGIFEVVSDKDIPRKKRFYRKDGEGYYYVPEVVENVRLRKM